jgi:hypothetical protein
MASTSHIFKIRFDYRNIAPRNRPYTTPYENFFAATKTALRMIVWHFMDSALEELTNVVRITAISETDGLCTVLYNEKQGELPLHRVYDDWCRSTIGNFETWWDEWRVTNVRFPESCSKEESASPTIAPALSNVFLHAQTISTLCDSMKAATENAQSLRAEAIAIEAAEKELAARRTKCQDETKATELRLSDFTARLTAALVAGSALGAALSKS